MHIKAAWVPRTWNWSTKGWHLALPSEKGEGSPGIPRSLAFWSCSFLFSFALPFHLLLLSLFVCLSISLCMCHSVCVIVVFLFKIVCFNRLPICLIDYMPHHENGNQLKCGIYSCHLPQLIRTSLFLYKRQP